MESFKDRYEMIEDVIENFEMSNLAVNTLEMNNKSGRTFDVVKLLHRFYPDVDFRLIIGADRAETIDTWYKADELLQKIPLIVTPRTIDSISSSGARELLKIGASDISSHLYKVTHDKILKLGLYTQE